MGIAVFPQYVETGKRMKLNRYASLLLVALLVAAAGPAFSMLPESMGDVDREGSVSTYQVLHLFMLAVDRGELILFDEVLTRQDIDPATVSLVLDIRRNQQTIEIYADLKRPLPCPIDDNFLIIGVTATLDGYNRIIETTAHVKPK
jgi:hypothetical protein